MQRPIGTRWQSGTPRRVLIVVLAAALVAVVALNIALGFRGGDAVDTVERTDEAVTVVDAMTAAGASRSVRGFVFDDAAGLRLCQARQRDPIACIGPFLELRNLDPASLPLEEVEVGSARFFHTPDPVTLVGAVEGTSMRVDDIAAAR